MSRYRIRFIDNRTDPKIIEHILKIYFNSSKKHKALRD